MRTSDAPNSAMLSRRIMASFSVHPERLDDLPQQRGTREKQSLGDWVHLRRERRRLVENQHNNVFHLGDSGFTEEDEEYL